MKKGFYKKIDDQWVYGQIITLPDDKVLDEKNTKNSENWMWYDIAPQEYVDWLSSQEVNHNDEISKTIENIECGYYKKYYQKYVFIYSTEDNNEELRSDGYKWYELAPEEYKIWLEIEKK